MKKTPKVLKFKGTLDGPEETKVTENRPKAIVD